MKPPKHDNTKAWVEILPPQKTGPDKEHEYGKDVLCEIDKPYGFIKLVIIPDGGVKRLRCFGKRTAGRK